MRKIKDYVCDYIDPYHQSFMCFRWHFFNLLVVLGGAVLLTWAWRSAWVHALLDNVFVYLPNYLTHEMLGHNLVGGIFYRLFYHSSREVGIWLATLAGNGVETLLPFALMLGALRLKGGRWLLPLILYWLSTTFYGAGVYAQDARTCSLPLTMSDMITNYAPGEICGDWNHILEPIGLLNYDQWVAYLFLFMAGVLFILAIYSLWVYWTRVDQYAQQPPVGDPLHLDEENCQPPNIYTPR